MDKDIQVWLFDILQSIHEIESYYCNKPKDFNEFVADIKTKRAIERDLEIIGEAANRILKKNKNFELNNVQKIIGTRNRIIHGYDKISDDLIWSIVINHLPKLQKEIEKLVEKKEFLKGK